MLQIYSDVFFFRLLRVRCRSPLLLCCPSPAGRRGLVASFPRFFDRRASRCSLARWQSLWIAPYPMPASLWQHFARCVNILTLRAVLHCAVCELVHVRTVRRRVEFVLSLSKTLVLRQYGSKVDSASSSFAPPLLLRMVEFAQSGQARSLSHSDSTLERTVARPLNLLHTSFVDVNVSAISSGSLHSPSHCRQIRDNLIIFQFWDPLVREAASPRFQAPVSSRFQASPARIADKSSHPLAALRCLDT